MRFIGRLVFYIVVAVIFLLLLTQILLHYLLPAEGVQKKITSLIAEKTKGEVHITSVSAGITGLTINGLSIGVPGGAEILTAQSVCLRVFPLKLIKGEIDFNRILIDGLKLNIIKDKNGKFNFDSLFSADAAVQPEPKPDDGEDSDSFIKDLRVKRLQIRHSDISYTDAGTNTKASLNDFFFDVYDFNFYGPFRVSLNSSISYSDKSINISGIPFGITVYPDLKLMKFDEAFADIRLIAIDRGDTKLNMKGNVSNLLNPKFKLNIKGQSISGDALKGIADIGEFAIDTAEINLNGSYNTAKNKLLINDINVNTLGSIVDIKGWAQFDKEPSYNLDIMVSLTLDKISEAFKIIQEYLLKGFINASFKLNNGIVRGNLSTKNLGFYYDQAGTFSSINSIIEVKNLKNIALNSLTGKLNGYLFRGAFSYIEKADSGDVNFNFQADKFLIKLKKRVVTDYDPDKDPVISSAPAISPEVKDVWFLPPLNIRGAVKIGALEAPFINATAVNFEADIRNFKPDIANIDGRLSLTTASGVIKDLYQLTNANAITKILFVSLGVVSKLINSLDVLSLLNTLSAAVLPADKQQQVLEANPDKIEGALNYDSFNINLSFKNGLSDIKSGSFVSSLLSFNIAGKINFNNRKINMMVNAAPGKHETGGIMPLRINVGGTVDNPQGNMSMLSSATSLVSQTIFNNPGSRIVKKGIGSIFGVFGIGSQSKKAKKAAKAAAADEFVPIELPQNPVEGEDEAVQTAE